MTGAMERVKDALAAGSGGDIMEEALRDSDARADRAIEVLMLALLAVDAVWILIGEVDVRSIPESIYFMYASMAQTAACLAVCALTKDGAWKKYVLVGSLMASVFLIIAGIDYSMMILMSFPVAACCFYYRSRLTIAVIVIGAVLMLVGLLINNHLSPAGLGLYYGMSKLEYYMNLVRVHYVVDMLIYLMIGAACFYATMSGIAEVRRQSDLRRDKQVFEREMSSARGIQQGLLISDFPCKECCDVASSMSAAKEVGGDFYDCFQVGDDRMAVVMADVSGKGLPAALFMATSMTLIRSNVQAGGDLAKAMEKAGRELASSNPMKYFVTAWVGVLDLKTGAIDYVDAGHNPPFVRKGGRWSMIECRPDFVFGRKKRASYSVQRLKLDPGDSLFLYTDGVTEAVGPGGGMFGEDGLEESLSSAADGSPEGVLSRVEEDLAAFVGGCDQSDDVTMMCVRFSQPYDHAFDEGIRVRADKEGYARVMEHLRSRMTDAGCPARTVSEMETACSEVFANIDMYAYAGMEEKGDVLVAVDVVGGRVRATFTDWGTPFDPLKHESPDPVERFRSRQRGGLGIMVVKRICDDLSYVRDGDRNILKLEKEIRSHGDSDREEGRHHHDIAERERGLRDRAGARRGRGEGGRVGHLAGLRHGERILHIVGRPEVPPQRRRAHGGEGRDKARQRRQGGQGSTGHDQLLQPPQDRARSTESGPETDLRPGRLTF